MLPSPACGVRELHHSTSIGAWFSFHPWESSQGALLPAVHERSGPPSELAPVPRSGPAPRQVIDRRLDGRRTAWRCLGQDFRIINPKPTADAYGNLSERRNLHRLRGIAHRRGVHARCPGNSSYKALKARPQLQCSSGNIAAQCRVFLVDASKPRGLMMTKTIRCWRCGGCHRGHEHGSHEEGRETARWFCHGAVRLS